MIRKKIAIFSGFYLPFLGGVERYTDKLSHELTKLGYDVVIVATNHANLPDYEKNDHISIYRLPSRSIFKNRYPIIRHNSKYRQLIKLIVEEKVDYVICNTRFQLTTLLGVRFAKHHGLKSLVIDHGSSHMSVSNKVLDFFGAIYEHGLTKLVKHYTKNFYGVSKRSSDWLGHFGIKSSGEFYNAVDKDTYAQFKDEHYRRKFPNKIVITYAGRIIKEKGIELLLQAFSELCDKYDNLVLVIAGDGPLLESLKKEYDDERIYFDGKLVYEDVMRLFNDTDIFCYPSMYPEGLPTSVLEAGIMKCAVIATDRGGTKEVIIDSKYGIIIEETTVSLRTALEGLITNLKLMTEMKNNLHQRVSTSFTWNGQAHRIDKILRSVDSEKS